MSDARGVRGRFAPGNPGGGRKPGSRNKLSEEFIRAMAEDFAKHGVATIERVRETEPAKYLTVIARIVPREIDLEVSGGPFASWTDQELDGLLVHIRKQIAANGHAPREEPAPDWSDYVNREIAKRNGGTH